MRQLALSHLGPVAHVGAPRRWPPGLRTPHPILSPLRPTARAAGGAQAGAAAAGSAAAAATAAAAAPAIQPPSQPQGAAPTGQQAAPPDSDLAGERVEALGAADTPHQPYSPEAQQYTPEAQQYVEVLVTTEVEEEVQLRPREVLQEAWSYCTVSNVGRGLSLAAVGLMLLTLGLALQRVYERETSPSAKRRRLIQHNKLVAAELSKYLPGQRERLTAAVIKGLQRQTGFTAVEVFRKYLWYVLRLGRFNPEAVQDIVAIKAAAGLTDDDVAEALRERAQRVYQQYGTLMLNTQGFTTAGLERRAGSTALFQKLLYLSECEELVAQASEAVKRIDLRTIFGATEEDLEAIRMASLYDVDLEKAFSQEGAKLADSDDEL